MVVCCMLWCNNYIIITQWHHPHSNHMHIKLCMIDRWCSKNFSWPYSVPVTRVLGSSRNKSQEVYIIIGIEGVILYYYVAQHIISWRFGGTYYVCGICYAWTAVAITTFLRLSTNQISYSAVTVVVILKKEVERHATTVSLLDSIGHPQG